VFCLSTRFGVWGAFALDMERQPLLAARWNPNVDAVDLADVPKLMGMRVFHLRLIIVIILLESITASMVCMVPYILEELIMDYGTKKYEVMYVHSFLMFGAVIGAFALGSLSDLYGRRTCLAFCCGTSALLALTHLALPSSNDWFMALLVLRFLLGICFGGILAIRYPYLVEFVPDSMRGRLAGFTQIGWPVTVMVCILVVKEAGGNWGWRVLLAIPGVCGSVGFIILCCMPESVRWLFVIGRQDDGYNTMRSIFASKVIMGHDPKLVDPPQVIVPKTSADHSQQWAVWVQLRSLLGNEWRPTTIVACLLFICTSGSTYASSMWTPHTVKLLLGAETHMYELFIWVEVCAIVSVLVVSCIVDWAGRKPSYVCSAIGAAICEGTLPWAVTSGNVATIYVNQFSRVIFMTINWTAMYTYISEAFPTPLRGSGAGFAACLGRLSSALVPLCVGAVLEVSVTWAFCLIATILLCGAVAALFMPQDMANSKMRDEV